MIGLNLLAGALRQWTSKANGKPHCDNLGFIKCFIEFNAGFLYINF